MASTKLKTTKDGKRYVEIRVRMGRDGATLSQRWYIPENPKRPWSEDAIDREVTKQAAAFEKECKAGNVKTRKEQKAEQAEAERKAEEEKRKAEAEAAKIKTFKQYGEQVFMPAKAIKTAENTRLYYDGNLRNHLYPAFGEMKLPEITSAQLRSYFLKLQDSELSHSSVIGIYVTCKQLLTSAFMDETIDRNPMDRVERPRQRKDADQKKETESFTSDELKQIIEFLAQEPLKWNTFCRLLMDTGIRRGEACGLRWKDIDFNACRATVCGNLQYSPDKGVYLQSPKTGKTRDVYFSYAVTELLKKLKAQQDADMERRKKRLEKEGKPLDIEKVTPSEFVFTEKGYNRPMHPQAPNRYFQKFGEKYGLDIHPHLLRHSFASVAITNGADIASVSECLGHADKATTLRMYTHADEESKRRAAAIVLQAIGQE